MEVAESNFKTQVSKFKTGGLQRKSSLGRSKHLEAETTMVRRHKSLSIRGSLSFGSKETLKPSVKGRILDSFPASLSSEKLNPEALRKAKKARRNTFAAEPNSKTMQSLNFIMNSLEGYLDELHTPKTARKPSDADVYDGVLDVIDYFGSKSYSMERQRSGSMSIKSKISTKSVVSKSWISQVQEMVQASKLLEKFKIKNNAKNQVFVQQQSFESKGEQVEIESDKSTAGSFKTAAEKSISGSFNDVAAEPDKSFEIEAVESSMNTIPQPLLNIVPQNLLEKLEQQDISTEEVCGYLSLHRKRTKEFNTKVMSEVFGDEEKEESILNVQVIPDLCQPVLADSLVTNPADFSLQDAICEFQKKSGSDDTQIARIRQIGHSHEHVVLSSTIVTTLNDDSEQAIEITDTVDRDEIIVEYNDGEIIQSDLIQVNEKRAHIVNQSHNIDNHGRMAEIFNAESQSETATTSESLNESNRTFQNLAALRRSQDFKDAQLFGSTSCASSLPKRKRVRGALYRMKLFFGRCFGK